MRANQTILRVAALAVFLALNPFLLAPLEIVGYLGEDSQEYLAFSEDILSGEILRHRPLEEVPIGRVIRPPVFPLMFAAASYVTSSRPDALFLLHTTLTILSWVTVTSLLSPFIPMFFTTILFSYVTNRYAFFFSVISSEWSCLCLLMVSLAALLRVAEKTENWSLALLSLLSATVALARPVFMFLPVAIGLSTGLCAYWRKGRTVCACLASGLFLLVGWMSFNKLYLDTWNPASLNGSAALVIGSMLGSVDSGSFKDKDLKQFSSNMSEDLFVASNDDLALTRVPGAPLAIFDGYVGNLQRARVIARQSKWNPLKMNEVFLQYGLRAIATNFERYLRHLYYGLQSFKTLLTPYCIPAIVIPLFWLFKRRMFFSAVWALGIVFLHVIHVGVVLLSQPLINRYFELTFGLVHFASGVVLILLVKEIWEGPLLRGRLTFLSGPFKPGDSKNGKPENI